jgi:Zn-finger nucleic acid-binding protein
MLSPKCPSCRERMSMAELELDGVWSCIYCEGTWLSAEEVRSLAAQAQAAEVVATSVSASSEAGVALTCPACETQSFLAVAADNYKAHCCTSCQGIFFGRGVLLHLCPSIARGQSGPEVGGKAFAGGVAWVVLSIASFGMS